MKQVGCDYCFTRDQPGMESSKILVSKDRATRMVSAHVVPLKGAAVGWVIQQCARDLEPLGHYGRVLLPFGTAVMFRVVGKVPEGVMTEGRHLGTWPGERFHTEEHIVARKEDGLVIRSRAVMAIRETTMDDLDAINGSPCAPLEY